MFFNYEEQAKNHDLFQMDFPCLMKVVIGVCPRFTKCTKRGPSLENRRLTERRN